MLPPPGQVVPTPELPAPLPDAAPIPWLDALKSLIFWAVFLGILGYSVYYYFSQRTEVVKFLRRLPVWRWLTGSWRMFWGGVRGLNRMVAAAVQAGLRRLRPAGGEMPWQYLSLRRLSPRERVRFFYQALVRRGAESGLPRRPAATPYEYESDLNAVIPEVDQDVAALTEAYIEARYSQHTISARLAGAVRKHWEQVRRVLRERQAKE